MNKSWPDLHLRNKQVTKTHSWYQLVKTFMLGHGVLELVLMQPFLVSQERSILLINTIGVKYTILFHLCK
jgi:hypothetical protein